MTSRAWILLGLASGCSTAPTQSGPADAEAPAPGADASDAFESPSEGGGGVHDGSVPDASDASAEAGASDSGAFHALLFSKTAGFRHDSIPDALQAIEDLGKANGFDTLATEDGSLFTDANLAMYQVVAFVLTTGPVLDDNQHAAFERYIRAGGGYVGIHSAADTEYNWAFYGGLMGAYFAGHPAIQQATIRVETHAHPSTASLPDTWVRTDELYNYQTNPRGTVTVLAVLDESTYTGGTMGSDHPHAWYHAYEGGRAFYTGGGHTKESYSEPLFLQHLLGGIRYAAGR